MAHCYIRLLSDKSPPHLDNSYDEAGKQSRPSHNNQTSHHTAPRPIYSRQGSNSSNTKSSSQVLVKSEGEKNRSKPTVGRKAVTQSWHPPPYAIGTQTSFNWRSGRPMAGMLELERSRTRRERTFIGSECAVCEEPLEHTLRGERILQFSCGHVSHEACFYEYIKEFDPQYCPTCNAPLGLDTSRGGNVLDIGMNFRYPHI